MMFSCAKLFEDPQWSPEDKAKLLAFRQEVQRRIPIYGVDLQYYTMFSVTQSIDIDLTMIPKDGIFMIALWVILFSELSQHIPLANLKYPNFSDFQAAYSNLFDREPLQEQQHLWHIANWMFELFRIVSAKKNKGLAMQVVPKLVEGWDAKYVTGSGQTRFTCNRVQVFETEGNTKANQRGKRLGRVVKKKANGIPAPRGRPRRETSGDFYHPKRKRRRSNSFGIKKEPIVEEKPVNKWVYNYGSDEDNEDDNELEVDDMDDGEDELEILVEPSPNFPFRSSSSSPKLVNAVSSSGLKQLDATVEQSAKRPRHNSVSSAHDHTDGDDDSVNKDFQNIYTMFSKPGLHRDESLLFPAHLELLRSQSTLNGDLEEFAFLRSALTSPRLQRETSNSELSVKFGSETCRTTPVGYDLVNWGIPQLPTNSSIGSPNSNSHSAVSSGQSVEPNQIFALLGLTSAI